MNTIISIKKKIRGLAHLTCTILLVLYGVFILFLATRFFILYLNFGQISGVGEQSLLVLLINGIVFTLLGILVFIYGLIPAIISGVILSIDPIIYVFGGNSTITLAKLSLLLITWVTVYDLWRKRRIKK